MQILVGFLYVLEVVVCFLLGGVILLQKPKEGGLGVSFGGGMGEALFGAQMGNVLTRATVILGFIFLANTLVLSILSARKEGRSLMEGVSQPAAPAALPSDFGGMPAAETPAAPAAVPVAVPAPE